MVGVFHGEKFGSWKPAREVAPHSNWDHFVADAVKDRDLGIWTALYGVGKVGPIIVAFD